jgi:hypothetical protein
MRPTGCGWPGSIRRCAGSAACGGDAGGPVLSGPGPARGVPLVEGRRPGADRHTVIDLDASVVLVASDQRTRAGVGFAHRFSSDDTNNDSCMRDDGTRYITLDAHDLDAINIGF